MLHVIRHPEKPTCLTFPNNVLLLPIFSVVDVDRAYPHVWVEVSLLNKTAQPAQWEMWKRFVRFSCRRYSVASCRAMMCHFSAICVSMVPGVPRRGPRFQFRILMRVFSRSWSGLQVSNFVFRRPEQTPSKPSSCSCKLSRVVGEGVAMGAVACHKEFRSVSRQRDPVNSTARLHSC